jgi:D-hexose-6-phosphate mutarotase
MFSYGEEMSTDPLEAMMLKEFVFLGKPRRVLEIGMFVGFGAVAMMEGCLDTQVVSLEIDPYLKGWLSSCLHQFPQIRARHEVVVGPALESLQKLQGTFDMVFIDANKAEYKDYLQAILERELLSVGGMVVCDNVLYNGYPYVPNHFDAQPARRGFGDAVKAFNQWVFEQPELEQIVLPIRDGVSLIRRRTSLASLPSLAPGCVRLHHQSGGTCDVSRYGAHVVSWCPQQGNEQLFLGSMAKIGEPGVAIRGGVPICWPQFGPFMEAKGAPGQKHGFMRTSSRWQLAQQAEDSVTFVMTPNEDSALWAADFEFKYTVSLGKNSMQIVLEVTNNGDEPIEFTGCLHTYYKCDAVDQCAVQGLRGGKIDVGIGDCFRGDKTEERPAVPFMDEKETQLMFGNASDRVILTEAGKARLRLTKSNMPDWVLWNTGAENGSGIKDLAEGEYRKYVCVEPAFASKPIHVAPGSVWVASHEAQLLEPVVRFPPRV